MNVDRVALLRSAEKLLRQGKLEQAIAEYRRIVDDQPRDWNTANVLGDLYMRAAQPDKAVEQFTRIADSLSRDGFFSKAGALYKKILKIRPQDEHALLQAGEMAARQELFVDARAYFNAVGGQRRGRGDVAGAAAITIRMASLEPADHDGRLAGARARIDLGDIAGAIADLKLLASDLADDKRPEQALAALREAARLAPADVDVKREMARLLAAHPDAANPDEALLLAGEMAEAAVDRGDWAAAAAILQQSLTHRPQNIPTLLRLVEIGVDGGLDSAVDMAQGQLADAYLASGSVAEARFIAEDLVARRPEEQAHIDRLRKILTTVGESDIDSLIANIRGLETLVNELEQTDAEPIEPVERFERVEPLELVEPIELVEPVEPVKAIDPISPQKRVDPVFAEIDLTIILDDIRASRVPSPAPRDLDSVFAQLREEASQRESTTPGEQEFLQGIALYRAGQIDDSVPRLVVASRSPRHRFEASSALGRIFLERGETWEAIEWLERAAHSPAPTPDDSHRLLYQLADALEAVGEVARALAICLELRAEAGEYQDVGLRVDRLSKVQAGG